MLDRFISDEERWRAVVDRNPLADGRFVYAVETTGVYCRPICKSRRPNRRNVRFFQSVAEADDAGYRACKRCRPDDPQGSEPHVDMVRQACESIHRAEENLTLFDLATAAGLSESHFHREFKRLTGVTPKQYTSAVKRERMRRGLERGAPVTQAICEAGYGSTSRFYENAKETLGMTASDFKGGGVSQRITFATTETSLGWLLVAVTAVGICAVELGDSSGELKERLLKRFPGAERGGDDQRLKAMVEAVVGSIESGGDASELPLDIRGTAFQQQVWAALRSTPMGETSTYSEIAGRIGKPTAARAVANACASNRVAVLIPCHRAVRSDGGLGGYRWGIERKRSLLEREVEK